MRLALEDIPEEGLDVAFTLGSLDPGGLGSQVERVIEPPRAELHLTRREAMVLARGRYVAKLGLVCSRCLGPVSADIAGDLDLVFEPMPAGGDELQLGRDDMDVTFYQGEEIDLGEALRDELALALPMAPLCSPDCVGLCPVCGKPRTEGDCGCAEKNLDPRWAKLAELDIEK